MAFAPFTVLSNEALELLLKLLVMKNLKNLKGVKELSKDEQKQITGGGFCDDFLWCRNCLTHEECHLVEKQQ